MITIPRLRPGRAVLWLLVLGAAAITVYRFAGGLGVATNLSDRFPWGLWNGFKLGAIGLAAGGFTMAAVGYVFHLRRYKPLVRLAVVAGFLGYLTFVVTLLIDLGRPYRIWHPIIMWNAHSVMFEIAWCVILYLTVLTLEFGQIVLERLGRRRLLAITRMALPPLVIAGVILSTLHQSSLGSLFLIVPGKLHALWFSPLLPVFFLFSAMAVGPAVVILQAAYMDRAYGRRIDPRILNDLGKAVMVVLALNLVLRVTDLVARGAWPLAFNGSFEAVLFDVEIVLGLIAPLVLLSLPTSSPRVLLTASLLAALGVILNRMNTAITGLLVGSRTWYVPSWMEIVVALGLLAMAILAYLWIIEHLPVTEEETAAQLRPALAPSPAPAP
ncbi:MAG TPA: NrfD/PsrC family molybdoenzyme membrane anchor subunit [bacterium]|nr:NrfD/PsrC family molybdoenzyme membrane anchor subunit [bacterium]